MNADELNVELASLREELSTAKRVGPTHFCGLPMSLNPHPEAGVPGRFLEVGTVSECIPCLVSSRHGWAKTASDLQQRLKAAERRNAELDLEWSRTITDRALITIELDKAKRMLERSATAMSAIRNNPSLVRDIDDFLKPTESGASE